MILHLLGKLNAHLRAGWLRRSFDQALALNRTEARPDGLRAEEISLRFAISWRIRNLHPWDSDLVGERRALKLVEQTFSDTEAALERLFVLLPEIDVIDLRVLEPDARRDGLLMSGSIVRREFETWHPSSTATRLKLVGLNYNLVNSGFEPLNTAGSDRNISSSGISAQHPDQADKRDQPYNSVAGVIAADSGPKHAWHQDKAGPH